MVTSCYRRMGNYQRALELYEKVHAEHPENAECLRYLVAICKDLGQPCDHYQAKLSRLDQRDATAVPGATHKGGTATGSNAAATVFSRKRAQSPPQQQHLAAPKAGASPTRTRSGRGPQAPGRGRI